MQTWIIVLCVLLALVIGFIIYKVITSPKKLKEWILYTVIYAEKELGTGTGQIKLRYVYDLFLCRFPVAAKLISFNSFSKMVDNAIDKMKELLIDNENINNYINKEGK